MASGSEGRRLGRTLLDHACTVQSTTGHRRAWLTTALGTRAERVYRAAGWRPAGMAGTQMRFEKPLPAPGLSGDCKALA